MAYVPPEYPGGVPEFAEIWPPVDDVNWMFTAAWDAIVKELRAVQIELGTDPAGAFATVKARLDDIYPQFHDRGDVGFYDWDKDDLIEDGTWRDLDLSAVVPAGAKAVLFRVILKDDAVESILQLRKKGNTGAYSAPTFRTQVANINLDGVLVTPCDINRVIQYKASNLVWTDIFIHVLGWWK